MTKRVETERLPDGRLQVILDETAEAAWLTFAALACDIVTAPREADPVEAKLAEIRGHLQRAEAIAEPLLFQPPLATERLLTADDIAAQVRRGLQDPDEVAWIRWPGSQRYHEVTGVSGRPGIGDDKVVHYKAPNGDEIGRRAKPGDTYPIVVAAEMAEAERRAA